MKQLIVPVCLVFMALPAACDRSVLDPIRDHDAGGGAAGEGGAGGSGGADSGGAGGIGGAGSSSGGAGGSGGTGGGGEAGGSGGAPSTGDSLWSRRFGADTTRLNLYGSSVAVDGAGNAVLATPIGDGVDFGGGPLSTGADPAFGLAKFDSGGHLLWDKQFSGTSYVNDVAVNSAGLIATTGFIWGSSIDFGGGPLVGTDGDTFVAVFNADGDHVWSSRMGGDSSQIADRIAVDAAGNVAVTGYFEGRIDICGASVTSAEPSDSFIAKFDPAGHCLWSKTFGYTGSHNVALDASGNVVLAGNFYGSFRQPNGIDLGGGPLINGGPLDDIFVAKFDAAGEHLWSKRFGDAEDLQRAFGVAVDGSGNVVITGTFFGSVDFGGGPLVITEGSNNNVSSEGDITWGGDIFVTKLNPAGELLWAKHLGGEGPESALDVATTEEGDIAITGFVYGEVDFGTGLMVCTYGDAFVAKLDTTGTVRWVKHVGGRDNQYGYSVATNQAGEVFATGSFMGTIDFGTGPLVNPKSYGLDIFLAKFGP